MKKILFFLLVTHSFISKSQIPFRGIVTEQNSGYTAIPNAQIKSDTSNIVSSDAKGNFNLLFQSKKEGDEVYLQAKKYGYEIVNIKEMATKIPKRQTSPFRVVMCKAGLLAQNKARYYGISEKYITQKYEKELAKLNRSTEGWREKAKKLEESFRSSLEFARELADKYSMMNLDDVSQLQRRAFRLYEENKVEEALKILEGENYQENIKQVKVEQKKIQDNTQLADNEIAKAEEIIQQQISKLMFQADLYAQDFQFDKAEKTYEIAAEADTTNYDNTFDFAYFLNNQNQHDRAIKYYLRVLKLAPSESYIATTQNNLGILYQTKNDYLAALKAYNRALEISERLAKTDPATYERGVANTQNNLGRLYKAKNDYPAALNAYSKALEIYERLAKTNPATYEPYVAMTQNNLGNLYKDKNDYPAALNAYSKALEIRERLAKTNPATYEPAVANTQNNLGVLYKDKNDYPAALNAYSKALEIYERLAKTNPATYEPYVAMTQNNLGNLYKHKNDYPAALDAYIKALKIIERLAKTNPATYEPDLAMTQNNLGNLYKDKNDYPAALNAYSKALEIYERLAKTNPATYEPNVATTQYNFGSLYQDTNDYPAALNAYSKALEIRERLAKTNPATYESKLAMTQNNLGLLYQAQNDYPAALSTYTQALEIYERLAKTNPEGYEVELCRSIVLLGLLQKADYQANKQSQLDSYLSKAKLILPNYPAIPLAQRLLDFVNDLEQYFKNMKVLMPIEALQNQLEQEDKYVGKIVIRQNIIKKYEELVQNGYLELTPNLGDSFSNLAWYQIFNKQFIEAEKSAKEALNPTTFSKTEDYDTKLEWANTNLALALLFQGKYAEAEKIYVSLKDKPYDEATYREAFLSDLEELEKAGITHPDVAKIRELLKK